MAGVPIKLLYEAKEHVITVEIKTGEMLRGYLREAEVSSSIGLVIREGFDEHVP